MEITPKRAYFKPIVGLDIYKDRNRRIYGSNLPISKSIKTAGLYLYHSAVPTLGVVVSGLAAYGLLRLLFKDN